MVPSDRCQVRIYVVFMMGETELVWGQPECMLFSGNFQQSTNGEAQERQMAGWEDGWLCRMNGEKDQEGNEAEGECG